MLTSLLNFAFEFDQERPSLVKAFISEPVFVDAWHPPLLVTTHRGDLRLSSPFNYDYILHLISGDISYMPST